MCQFMTQFETDKYVYLPKFLDKENCNQLVQELRNLIAEGATTKDSQCYLSEAVYGAPIFDSLLEQLLPNFEFASGKKLYPTYSYARLYAPGEELKPHTDRESCEISVTITLGFDGKSWPIYMGDYSNQGRQIKTNSNEKKYITNEFKIDMDVGDAVMYRGMDKVHWRKPYKEGNWQAQVFLHYVDSNGPHASWKYDKRQNLSHKEKINFNYWFFSDALSSDACKKLIQSIESQVHGEDAQIGLDLKGIVNKEIRDVKKINLPSYRGIGATMVGLGMSANHQSWQFDITHSNQTDYLIYDVGGHYIPHIDTFIKPGNKETRKLTVLVFLNDEFEGGRFFIQDGHTKIYPPQSVGSCLVFPSFLSHGVEPVTNGIRRSIVTWLLGPWFK